VIDWLDDVDLYLQPSFQEGLPRAMVEAMSRACPAIGSTAGGIPELLPPECLVRPGDAAELRRLICEIANDTERQSSLAQRNFQIAKGFNSDVLNAQRTAFWKRFTRFCNDPPG
jgi:glycosyltransferase involved in cell wall biosynthesis